MKLVYSEDTIAGTKYAGKVAAGFFTIFFIDCFWIGFLSTKCNDYTLGPLRKMATNKKVTITAMVCVGIISSVVGAVFEADTSHHAAAIGALIGFVVFFIYDATTLAIIQDYRWFHALVDVIYGSIAWTVMLTIQHQV